MASDKPVKGASTNHSLSWSAKHGGIHKLRKYARARVPPFSRKSQRGNAAVVPSYHEMVGSYQTEITSGERLRCGVFALEISTAKQLNGLTLKPKEFDELFRGRTSQAWHEKMGWTGPEYQQQFHDEQLGLILYLWGRRHGKTLQLGVVLQEMSPFLLPLPVLEGEEFQLEEATVETVWIHNDYAQVHQNVPYNHFSGITILEPPRN